LLFPFALLAILAASCASDDASGPPLSAQECGALAEDECRTEPGCQVQPCASCQGTEPPLCTPAGEGGRCREATCADCADLGDNACQSVAGCFACVCSSAGGPRTFMACTTGRPDGCPEECIEPR
jgi:hypothetical protein